VLGICAWTGFFHEIFRLHRVGQHLLMAEFALGANAIFFTGITGFQRAQATQLTFHRHPHGV
jgi:hypothetical protein